MTTPQSYYANWPKTYVRYLILDDPRSNRAEEAFTWLHLNVTEYMLQRRFGIDYDVYIKDPKLMTLFQLKFGDVCITPDETGPEVNRYERY